VRAKVRVRVSSRQSTVTTRASRILSMVLITSSLVRVRGRVTVKLRVRVS